MAKYMYDGFPLTPAVASSLIGQLFNGKDVKRSEIINKLMNHHIQSGGVKGNANITANVKIALQTLEKKGLALKLPIKGFWKILPNDIHQLPIDDEEIQDRTLVSMREQQKPIAVYPIVGDGTESVYLYWFPSHKELATLKTEAVWKCKIGRSLGNVEERVNDQCGTSNAEAPIIGLVIKTPNCAELEEVLHKILKFKGKHVQDAVGKEWFLTSPNEVLLLYSVLLY